MKLIPCLLVMVLLLIAESTNAQSWAEKMSRWTKSVHQPIEVQNLTKEAVRLAVLEGMWYTRGYTWYLEKETDNAVTTRFDYRGRTIVFDIVYSKSQVRILFVDGNNGYECEELDDGVCHENLRDYYNYSKNLRASIEKRLARAGGIR